MLVDDNPHDNFFHERQIKQNDSDNVVITMESAKGALEYLKSKEDPHSDLIFLDINMPGMNGWEFLEAYNKLDKELQNQAIIIMLTTSASPMDVEKSKALNSVSDYITKPLTEKMMKDITAKYFGE
jgi:CheY-like chemotaxis protein